MKNLRSLCFILPICSLLALAVLTSSCSDSKQEVKTAVEEHLKDMNTRSIEIDLYHTSPGFPGKAYVSATVTYNFATAEGTFQKEYLGYILKREGQSWKVEQNTGYTKDPSKADNMLSGNKG